LKKTFDAVTWMRERRAEIDEEDQGLSWEEKRQKTRDLLEKDPLWLKLGKRLVVPAAIPAETSRKHMGEHNEKTF
jgi:hypothetical protein